jgi:hypothetical protein
MMKTNRRGLVFLWVLGAAGVLGAACSAPFGIGAPIPGTGGGASANASAGTGGAGMGGAGMGGAGGATPGSSSSSVSSTGSTASGVSSSSSSSGTCTVTCDTPPVCHALPATCTGSTCSYAVATAGTPCQGGLCNGSGTCEQNPSSSSSSSSGSEPPCGGPCPLPTECCCVTAGETDTCVLLKLCASPGKCAAMASADAG